MSRCCAHARRPGFTLLELLVVMVIAAIAIMMAAPTIGRGLMQTSAQQAAATIAQDLQRGLTTASRTRRPVTFTINTDSMVYHLADGVDGTVFNTRHIGEGSDFGLSSLIASQTTITMLPNGTIGAASLPVQFTIRAGDHRRAIRITRAGMIYVEAL